MGGLIKVHVLKMGMGQKLGPQHHVARPFGLLGRSTKELAGIS